MKLLMHRKSLQYFLCCAVLCLVAQSCLTLCDLMDCSPPGYTVAPLSVEILQARILEWIAISSCKGSSQPRDQIQVSHTADKFFTTEPPGWRRQWHPTPVFLPGKSHGWRSLVGCSPWGRKESDTTERLHFHFSLSCIGEGNGNPLQCSYLENPRDG